MHIKEIELANCIRFLSADAVLSANSGHIGMCLGLADVMSILFREFLVHDPQNPQWANRDRVVLSNGHGSMLLYSALYLSGYDWTIDDLKQFRQLGSAAPGHPEYDPKRGIETTTGPLGQGLASAVGMALAKERLGHLYGVDKINYTTYCFVGDGCLMEGISHEACALAPNLIKKGLVVLWDDNGISIDGEIDPWFEKDVLKRFESYGFHVIRAVDGHDPDSIRKALTEAGEQNQPCFIQLKTVIGKGCLEIEGKASAHGQPLTAKMVEKMRSDAKWGHEPFVIPIDLQQAWDMRDKAKHYDTAWSLPKEVFSDKALLTWFATQKEEGGATRKLSAKVLQEIAKQSPRLMGGSADLTESNLTGLSEGILNGHHFERRYVSYGVREFAMFAIANGLAVSGLTPYVGTFLTFVDYGKNALRLSALMNQRVIYILTHDSIGLGEDGPTHQPVEQLTMCRATPNLEVWRPCNMREVISAWTSALQRQGPTVLALSRQHVAAINTPIDAKVEEGVYLLSGEASASMTILATGSEVEVALKVWEKLQQSGIDVKVLSVPCLEKAVDSSLLQSIEREQCFVIEAGSAMSWHRWAPHDHIFSVDRFGESADAKSLYAHFALDPQSITDKIMKGQS